ncbi:hypothetical protein MSBR3_0504 [Methanosarcina barkeri 3]|uniref:Uncharacterized protein n=1 Tax=Methanosarcina barkeri 3 TaxID=1434107 RepID=A0A0E3SJW1_METBA|nr:hypothetical protein [Methanosarcina barkeri]AKB81082.1 hypothetical protein MSBR3_0504 [Methanosarcina barkeri 3]
MITLNEAEAVEVSLSAVDEGDENRAFQALDSLTGIAADFLSENEKADAERVILSIESSAQAAAEREMELVTINSILSLGKLARKAADNGFESVLDKAFVAIGKLGKTAAAHSLEAGSKVAATTLMEIWNFSPEEWGQEKVIAFSLLFKEIGTSAARRDMEEVMLSAVTCLGEIGKKVAAKNLELETVSSLLLLEEIGKLAVENYFDEALSSTALSIEDIGKLSIKKGLNDAVLQCQWTLETLRVQAEEKALSNSSVVAEVALDNFKDIGYTSSEEKTEKFQGIKAIQKKIQSDLEIQE